MKLVIGGTIGIVFGVFGVTAYFSDLIKIIQGVLPLILIVGGILVIMLKREEDIFESESSSDQVVQPQSAEPESIEPESIKPDESTAKDSEAGVAGDAPQSPLVMESDPPEIEPIQKDPLFIGNESSLVFHTPTCNFSTSKKCTASFSSREEAVEKGYKPCSICKP